MEKTLPTYFEYVDKVLMRKPSDGFAAHFGQYFDQLRLAMVQDGKDFDRSYILARDATQTPITFAKTFRRYMRGLNLFAAYRMARRADGSVAECGVFRGFSALFLMMLE